MSGKDLPVTVRLVAGASLACLVCGYDLFVERKAQMRFSTSQFGWLRGWKVVKCRVCERCGFMHVFHEPERRLEAGG